jgi:hypothetical protein
MEPKSLERLERNYYLFSYGAIFFTFFTPPQKGKICFRRRFCLFFKMSWPSAAVAVALAWAVPLLIKARASAVVAKQRARSAAAAKACTEASIAQMARALAAEHKPAGFDAATLQPIVTVAERVRNAPLAARALLHDILARAVASTQRLNNVRRSCAVGPVVCVGVCTAAAGARGFAWRAGQRVKAFALLLVCYSC